MTSSGSISAISRFFSTGGLLGFVGVVSTGSFAIVGCDGADPPVSAGGQADREVRPAKDDVVANMEPAALRRALSSSPLPPPRSIRPTDTRMILRRPSSVDDCSSIPVFQAAAM